ncbi:MAG: glycosyltransferase, partial [Pontixanthobacter sp.]
MFELERNSISAGSAPVKRDFLQFEFDVLDMRGTLNWIEARMKEPRFRYVVTPNVDHVVRRHERGDIRTDAAYDAADLCVCDSRILARLAGRSDLHLPLVPGSDLTRQLLDYELTSGRVAVIGGDAPLHDALRSIYDRFDWQFFEPPMGVLRDPKARDAIAQFVENAKADIVLFAIG